MFRVSRMIDTARLELRPWRTSDVDAALAIFGEPDVRRWLVSAADLPATADGMRRRLERWAAADEAAPSRCTGHWAVCERSTSTIVGAMALGHPQAVENVLIEWALAVTARGRGYAAEAGDALVRWAIHEAGAIEVFALVDPDNERARSIAERIGMECLTELAEPDGRNLVYRIRHGDLDDENGEG